MFKKVQLKFFLMTTSILLAIFITVLSSINIIMQAVMQRQSKVVLQQIASSVEYDEKTSSFTYHPEPDENEKPPKEPVTTTSPAASESKDNALDYANKAAATEIRVNAKATDVETNRQFVADAKQQVASDRTACEDAVTKCAGYVGYTKTGFIVKDDGKVQFIYYND